ncbi:MAG TPA: methylmalonyl-CoA mutase family protein [Thermoflexales bacterium]|mgnify:CR=1 FL=1|nr:methylmalonyl-CoA mutase family protein [Thermoflexales bacterium]HQW33802.1 methylmalonyl-CoA mutase family protein [Thermoflexales bacterium]
MSNHDVEQNELREKFEAWERNELAAFLARSPERKEQFATESGIPLKRVYTALDAPDDADIGLPGQFPFTRGPYPTMYRGRLWTMRLFAGYGTGEDTNARFKFLIEQGQTGLSTAFDMPTLMGYDSDHPLAAGEVGREGVAIDTLADMEALFDGIDLTKISVSMTINPTAWILLAMYVALGQKRGYDLNQMSGTLQADILKEYQAQKEWIYPIRPSVRLVRDFIMWSAQNMRRYNPISISGYHIAEAGANAIQEASFVLANGFEYVRQVTEAGMSVDDFAPRLSFFWTSQADFFEEIAKFRAARRVWAKVMKERFGAKNPDSQRLRFHAQTAAITLTRTQPYNNLARTTLQALAAALGGAQSLHTNGFDESYALPTEFAAKLALRTQQIIAEETNITSVVDPLGGSYFVESLTSEMEKRIFATLDEIDAQGGVISATENGWFQRQIADTAYDFLKRKERGERVVVGVNKYAEENDPEIPIHPHNEETERKQIAGLRQIKAGRDGARVGALLAELKRTAQDENANLMPITIECVKAYATLGEIVDALRGLWGAYREGSEI